MVLQQTEPSDGAPKANGALGNGIRLVRRARHQDEETE